jgi:acetyl-CoA carboxylase biotin carboxyl carrier protein
VRIGNRRPPPAPDADLVRNLAALLEETGLSEIEYESSGYRIRVARGVATTVAVAPAPALAQAAAPPPPAEIAQANGLDHHPGAVTAPMVGVAYLAPQPGLPPFVKIGDTVTEGQTLLIIEAMKVMNQIRAPRAGRVAQILVTDADAVEYGAALMLIE